MYTTLTQMFWEALPSFVVSLALFLWLFFQTQALRVLYRQNQEILRLLRTCPCASTSVSTLQLEATTTSDDDEEDEEFIDSSYQIPYFSDDEEDEEYLPSRCASAVPETTSSGYDTEEMEVDMDWEIYKIQQAPAGPVPEERVFLTLSCRQNNEYVKAVVDEDEEFVEVFTYRKNDNSENFGWVSTVCQECRERVEKTLKDGGCEIPILELELEEESDSDADSSIGVIEQAIEWPEFEFIDEQNYHYDYDTVLYED